MDSSTDNEIKIANYFDNKMDAAEQEAFLQKVRGDNLLSRQFENELLIRSFLYTDDNYSSLDDCIETSGMIRDKGVYKISRNLRNYLGVAALLILVILSVHLLLQKKSKVITVAQIQNHEDTTRSEEKAKHLFADNNSTEAEYKKFYRKYTSWSDPVEVSKYYNDYVNNNYLEVINSEDSGFAEKGLTKDENYLMAYVQLYKGLCYLAEAKPEESINRFSTVLKISEKGGTPYYEAEWYSALAWLKAGNRNKSVEILEKIQYSRSPHLKDAVQLLHELNTK
ncbi:MAG TPA: hypothetical protein VG738_19285 [Chitinophagaceae bacterium]|nr:hypothetical protein [Chitinophagaceae bacterium]